MNWDLVGYLKSSDYRLICICSLSSGPKTPSDIVDEEDIRPEYVSRALSNLRDKNLVNCMTPNRKKGRIYRLTQEGKSIIEEMEREDII